MTKPKKYDHNQFTWYNDDMDPKCRRKVFLCPKGYKGHKTSQLNQNVWRMNNGRLELQFIKLIAHSHFTHETDRCRHLTCEIGRDYIDAELCDTEYVLHKKTLPAWVRIELYGE